MKKGKKFIALFLVFSLMMLSANLYAKERRGVELIITKKDGQQTQGELITVKPNSLLLLDTEGKDVSVEIEDIMVIKIFKGSKIYEGAKIGGFIGLLGGVIISLTGEEQGWSLKYVQDGIIGGLIGLVIGGVVASLGEETIQIEGMSDLEIKEAMDKLRKKARIRDYK